MRAVACLREAVHLGKGKDIGSQYQLCRRDWKTLRQPRHPGIAAEVYTFDRMPIESLENGGCQYHASIADQFQRLAGLGGVEEFELTEWVVVVGCGCHDAHNALKWGGGVLGL